MHIDPKECQDLAEGTKAAEETTSTETSSDAVADEAKAEGE